MDDSLPECRAFISACTIRPTCSGVPGGGAIGIVLTYVMSRDSVRMRFAVPILGWIHRFPGPCYTFAFLLCFELITQFDEIRLLEQSVSKALPLHGTASIGLAITGNSVSIAHRPV